MVERCQYRLVGGVCMQSLQSHLFRLFILIPSLNTCYITATGKKLLKKMGWVEGGVGKEGNEGIAEPVSLIESFHRHGLGASNPLKLFQSRVRRLVNDYVAGGNEKDLVFRGNFLKEERAMIHNVCSKYHLKSKWHGRQGEDVLVLSRRRSPLQLLRYVKEVAGTSHKYFLVHPSPFPTPSDTTAACSLK